MILPGQDPAAVERAVQTLAAGELLGLPTETVYGLAADALRDEAVAKIFKAKGRPAAARSATSARSAARSAITSSASASPPQGIDASRWIFANPAST